MTEKLNLSGLTGRQLKKRIRHLMASDADIGEILEAMDGLAPRVAVNPLFACFYDMSPRVKWRAVAAMGYIVSRLGKHNMESARVIMRRLMWNLNDESGGIGWGSPEAMGEIMAQNHRIADEYGSILTSYIQKGKNFLEHEGLQRGSIWGVGRLAQARPELVADAADDLRLFLKSPDPYHRGYAAWALGNLGSRGAVPEIEQLVADQSELEMFQEQALKTTEVGLMAKEALAAIEDGKTSC